MAIADDIFNGHGVITFDGDMSDGTIKNGSVEFSVADFNGNTLSDWVGETETCPKCGKQLIKDENGECIECNRKHYFIVEIEKSAYEKIKSGKYPYVPLPIDGIAQTDIISSELKQNDNGDFVTSLQINYGIVKLKQRRSKKCIAFEIYDALFFGEKEILLFFGKQVGIVGEEITDKCDVDMEAKSREFIEKYGKRSI